MVTHLEEGQEPGAGNGTRDMRGTRERHAGQAAQTAENSSQTQRKG